MSSEFSSDPTASSQQSEQHAASATQPAAQLRTTLVRYARILDANDLLLAIRGGSGWLGQRICHVTYDSRTVVPDTLFICKGAAFKQSYLEQAAAQGAVAYVSERAYRDVALPCLLVSDIRRAMGLIAAEAYSHPADDLAVCAYTGTKGKTTSSYYLKGILDAEAQRLGTTRTPIFSTIEFDDGIESGPSKLTTPEPIELEQHLANAREAGAREVVMEASSQALKYGRVIGVHFAVGAFLNISEDHISPIEHPTFEDYFSSKLLLFSRCDQAVVNLDTDHVDEILAAASRCRKTITYSMTDARADVYLMGQTPLEDRMATLARVRTPRFIAEIEVPSMADFNISNALSAIACAEALQISEESIVHGLADVRVPGRMQVVDMPGDQIVGIVDYAHNGGSLEALLTNLRSRYPGREIVVVFGATGTKGVERREGMGTAAGKLADRIVVTEDDPGKEDPADICATIMRFIKAEGNHNARVVLDRTEAIRTALLGCTGPAVVAVAGKGHETRMLRAEGAVPYEGDAQVLSRLGRELLG